VKIHFYLIDLNGSVCKQFGLVTYKRITKEYQLNAENKRCTLCVFEGLQEIPFQGEPG
jgi:hypothetical protein